MRPRKVIFYFSFLCLGSYATVENKNVHVRYTDAFMEKYLHMMVFKSENINMITRNELLRTISPSFKKEICR